MNKAKHFDSVLSLTQKITVLLYGANCSEPIRGKLWFQKELFLISKAIPELEEEAEFESDFMGPYSELADEQADRLRIEQIIDSEQKQLTPLGHRIEHELEQRFSSDTIMFIQQMKTFLNDLSKDELLGFIYYSYPDMRLDSVEFHRISLRRKEIAVSLFKKRKVSLGKAAVVAGLTQEELIKLLQSLGIAVFAE
jgi:predicted HTH domain antitoxin